MSVTQNACTGSCKLQHSSAPTFPVKHCFYCFIKLDGASCFCGAVDTKQRSSEWPEVKDV